MDKTQHFRLAGTTAIEKIDYDHVDGHNVIYWDDIELAFPGVKHVKCNDVIVKPLRDSDQKRIIPPRIKHYPGVVLDVMISSSDGNTSTAASQSRDSMEDVVENLQVASPGDTFNNDNNVESLPLYSVRQQSPPSDVKDDTKTVLSLKRVVERVQTLSMESKFEQQLLSSHPSDLQVQARTSTNTLESLVQTIGNGLANRSDKQLAALHELKDNVMDIKDKASMILELVIENRDLTARVLELQEEVKQLQIQALDRLALLQNSVKALLTQTYELHEYPIPRLFIVLPQDSSSWNPLDFFSNKFRLYFLCECGEHTKATNSKIPHHIHLAKHEGYEIDRPNEFFRQYGPYVLTVLKMLKYGITAAGIAVPALSHLIRVDALDQATEGLKSLTNTIEPGMNQVINHIEKVSADDGGALIEPRQQMENNEALEGADLRQLETFLKNKDNNRVLGNLFRTVTGEGHVKWVCLDHFRENYHEKAAKAFRDAVDVLNGSFNEGTGRVEVILRSRLQAEEFYLALEKARSVYELKVTLDWETTQSDFKKLRDILAITNVGVLELHLPQQDITSRNILNRNQRLDPVLDIIRHRSIQSLTIRGPCNFTKRSSLLSHNYDLSNLRHLDISLDQLKDDAPGIKHLIAKAPNLSSLTLGSSAGHNHVSEGRTFGDMAFPPSVQHLDLPLYHWRDDIPGFKRLIANASNLSSLTLRTGPLESGNGYVLEAYEAITKVRTYPINFKKWRLRIPPPSLGESNQSMTAQQSMELLLKVYCTSPRLDVDRLGESTVDTIAKASTDGFLFTRFELSEGSKLSDSYINNISSIISRSELDYIHIWMREDVGRVSILESIQWKRLRELKISLRKGTFEPRVMRALVDGVTKMSEKVELDRVDLWSETFEPLTLPEDLLRDFLSSTSIRVLKLYVNLTVEQILSLFGPTGFPSETLKLWTKGFDSAKVDAILGGFQHVTKQKELQLLGANITDEQKSRMKARGITLDNSPAYW